MFYFTTNHKNHNDIKLHFLLKSLLIELKKTTVCKSPSVKTK